MAEQFVALGEALVATEALKEFGEEALTAYGTLRVSASAAAAHRFAEQADSIIEQIKALAATEPFAFPEIAPTIQRMVALGVSESKSPGSCNLLPMRPQRRGEQLPAGGQFLRSACRCPAPQAGARQLVQLGISATGLAAAMGVTGDAVTTAFKALDQSQRIAVLQTAMQKFSGAAEAQAQGISGAWQIFQNQFEEVMVGIGESLTPVVQSILGFVQTMLSGAQSIAAAFNNLPGPIKDFLVVIGLTVAAIVPLTAAISALGFGWIGLQAAGSAASGIMTTLGISSAAAAAGEELAAQGARDFAVAEASMSGQAAITSLTQLGTTITGVGLAGTEAAGGIVVAEEALTGAAAAAATAGGSYSALGISVGGLATVMAGPGIAAILATKSNLDTLRAGWVALDQEMVNSLIVKGINAGQTLSQLEAVGYSAKQVQTAIGGMSLNAGAVFSQIADQAKTPIAALTSMGVSVGDIQTALKDLQVNGVPVFAMLASSPSLAAFKESITALGGNLDLIIQKLNQLQGTGQAAFSAMTLGIHLVLTPTQQYGAALATLHTEAKALTDDLTTAKGVLAATKAAYDDGTASALELGLAEDAVTKAQKALTDAVSAGKNTAEGLITSWQTAQKTFNNAQTAFEGIKAAFDSGTASAGLYLDALGKLQGAAKGAGTTFTDATALAQGFTLAAGNQVEALQTDILALKSLQDENDLTVQGWGAWNAALAKATSAASALGITVTATGRDVVTSVTNMAGPAAAALKPLSDNFNSTFGVVQQLGVLINGKFVPALDQITAHTPPAGTAVATFRGIVSDATNNLTGWIDKTAGAADGINVLKGSATAAVQGMGGLNTTIINTNGSTETAATLLAKLNAEIAASETAAGAVTGSYEDEAKALEDMADAAQYANGQLKDLNETQAAGGKGGGGKGTSVSAQEMATSMQAYAQNPFLSTNVISVGSLPGIFGQGAAYIGTAMASLGAGFNVLASATAATSSALYGSGLHAAVVATTVALDAGLPAVEASNTATETLTTAVVTTTKALDAGLSVIQASNTASETLTTTVTALNSAGQSTTTAFYGLGPALDSLGNFIPTVSASLTQFSPEILKATAASAAAATAFDDVAAYSNNSYYPSLTSATSAIGQLATGVTNADGTVTESLDGLSATAATADQALSNLQQAAVGAGAKMNQFGLIGPGGSTPGTNTGAMTPLTYLSPAAAAAQAAGPNATNPAGVGINQGMTIQGTELGYGTPNVFVSPAVQAAMNAAPLGFTGNVPGTETSEMLSSTGLNLTAIAAESLGTNYAGTGNGEPSGTTSGINLNITVQAGTVVGQNGMQQLAQTVGQVVIQQMKGSAGLKLF